MCEDFILNPENLFNLFNIFEVAEHCMDIQSYQAKYLLSKVYEDSRTHWNYKSEKIQPLTFEEATRDFFQMQDALHLFKREIESLLHRINENQFKLEKAIHFLHKDETGYPLILPENVEDEEFNHFSKKWDRKFYFQKKKINWNWEQ